MTRPLTIFCGKGGVGKTTLSLAFALWHARQGRRALVVTSHPLAELALSVSLAGLEQKQPQAAANLFVVHIDPREVIGSTVRENLPSTMLADAVLSSRIYQSLIEVVPGLKEIAFVSRIRQLAEQRFVEQVQGRFDLLVWDAPATGHFLRTLEVSRSFDSYLSGPLALLGKDLVKFLSDPSNITILPVTILEEMAVQETIELCETLVHKLNMPLAGVICNMASPLLDSPDATFEDLERSVASEASSSGDLRFILDRHAIDRALFRKLHLALGATFGIVRRMPGYSSDLELLFDVARQVGSLPGDKRP